MKKNTKILALALALLTIAIVVSSCASSILLGTYSSGSDAGGTLVGYKVSYTFKGVNTVIVTTTSTILGSSKTTEYKGTYELKSAADGTQQITLTFESDDASSYSGTYAFSKGVADDGKTQTITIGMTTYTKVK